MGFTPSSIFVFVGGGTGGHLFPGLAIAEEINAATGGTAATAFVCSDRPIDEQILKGAGVEYYSISAKPLVLRPKGLWRFLAAWGPSVRNCRALYRQLAQRVGGKDRVHVVAMGGFVAAPAVRAARAEGLRVTLVNLDAQPGKANRWIARMSDHAVSVFEVNAKYAANWRVVPPIVRAQAIAPGTTAECRSRLGLNPDQPVLMVTGGSQGAGTINRLMIDLLKVHHAHLSSGGWQVLHQCGRSGDVSEAELVAAYRTAGVPAVVSELVAEIGCWWGAAELTVSRAGAGSVAEAWANQVPTLFLPYPYHKDQHQRLNALRMTSAGAGVLAVDLVRPEANALGVLPVLAELVSNAPRRDRLRQALSKLGKADGAKRVAAMLLATGPGGGGVGNDGSSQR